MHDEVPGRQENGIAGDVASPADVDSSSDLVATRLLVALRSRAGHILVTGEDAKSAAALFTEVERQVPVYCSVRVNGRSLDPDAVVLALWKSRESVDPSLKRHQMVQVLVEDARLVKLPIFVVVIDADAADAGQLDALRRALEGAPDANEVVRIILLGGPRVSEVLARPESRALATRIVASVHVPPASARSAPVAAITNVSPPVAQPETSRFPLVAVLGATALLAAWLFLRTAPERSVETAPVADTTVVQAPPAPEQPLAAAPPVVPEAIAPPPAVAPAAPAPSAAAAPTTATPPPVAPAAAPPSEVATAPSAPKSRALQVGAFLSIERAEALRAKLAQKYKDVYVAPVDRDGKTFYRVRVGGLTSDADLAAATTALREAGLTPIRVPNRATSD